MNKTYYISMIIMIILAFLNVRYGLDGSFALTALGLIVICLDNIANSIKNK